MIWRDPIFWLAVIGWFLGIRVVRFWLDWGLPALCLWLAYQFDELFESRIGRDAWQRFAITGLLAFLIYSGVATDRDGRWSQYENWQALDASHPEQAKYLPDPGGILYNVNLSVFYQTFFVNPHGDWRYALGFEPSFMVPENYSVYNNLWRTRNAVEATAPWVQKMTLADRLFLVSGPEPRPTIPQLEWAYPSTNLNLWVGRVPRLVPATGDKKF
jgi:hypothetical protein